VEEPREIRRGWMYTTPRRRMATGLPMHDWASRTAGRIEERAAREAES
jgi:hypothetical protein